MAAMDERELYASFEREMAAVSGQARYKASRAHVEDVVEGAVLPGVPAAGAGGGGGPAAGEAVPAQREGLPVPSDGEPAGGHAPAGDGARTGGALEREGGGADDGEAGLGAG